MNEICKTYRRKQILLKISICFLFLLLINVSVYANDMITSSVYKIEDGYISKIKSKTTVEEFKKNVNTDQEMVFTSKKKKTMKDSEIITTDTILSVGDTNYTLVVKGDVDGNGLVNTVDLSKVKLCESGKLKPTESMKRACDINDDGQITDIDVNGVQKIILGYDVNYDFSVTDLKTYNEEIETNLFAKNEDVIIRFKSEYEYYVEKVKIAGKEYSVAEIEDNTYEIVVNGFSEVGNKTIKFEEITLNNGQMAEIDESLEITIIKDRPVIFNLYYEEEETQVKLFFKVIAEDFETLDGTLIITDEYGNEVKNTAFVKGENEIIFDKSSTIEYYYLKFVATYDDGNATYENDEIYDRQITVNSRAIEMKDIKTIKLYKKTGEEVHLVSSVNISDLENFDDYIVKVEMRYLRSFYTTIRRYKEEDGKLKFVLNYDDIVQYNGNEKMSRLEVVYGDIENGVATRIDLARLAELIQENPAGDYVVTSDFDATDFNTGTAVIPTEFTGTLDFQGHKITNLSKPLFNSVNGGTIKNLVIDNVKLSGANSKGAIANVGTNINIKNVHIKNLVMTTGANQTAGFIGTVTGGIIEECSLTNFNVSTSGHIRVAGFIAYATGATIKNCYVEGKLTSIQSKDGNGIGGVLGHAYGSDPVIIENCIAKMEFDWTGGGPRLNGGILGLSQVYNKTSYNAILKNNVSLCTGGVINKVYGSPIDGTSINNYELEDPAEEEEPEISQDVTTPIEKPAVVKLVSNASGDVVKIVAEDDVTEEFYRNSANFDENIWDLTNASYDNLPKLKNSDPNHVEDDGNSVSSESYIPDYDRIKKLDNYDSKKEIAYSNLYKLMPFYDAKYLLEDGENIAVDDILNTKYVKYALPFDTNNKLITYLTEEDYQKIAKIIVVFTDYTVKDYAVGFDKRVGNIAVYKIADIEVPYSYNNYVIHRNAHMVNKVAEEIKKYDYVKNLDPLTSTADSRLYKDHYNADMKGIAAEIAVQLLENDENNGLSLNNSEVLNQKIQNDLIDSGKLKDIIYTYNYFYRWYNFEIGGAKVSDIILFHGKMYSDDMKLDHLVTEVFSGNIATNATSTFYVNNLKKYTGSSTLQNFLNYLITNVGKYEDVNDWFTEYFGQKGIIKELPVKGFPQIKYRAWTHLNTKAQYVLPFITLPKDSGYIMSGGAFLLVGSQKHYSTNPSSASGQRDVKNAINGLATKAETFSNTLAGMFNGNSWNSILIYMYDTRKFISGYKQLIPGVPGTEYAVYSVASAGTSEPFHKNFNEAVNVWGKRIVSSGYADGTNVFFDESAATDFKTWSHELGHNIDGRICLSGKARRGGSEDYTDGNVTQHPAWDTAGGGYHFNLISSHGRESLVTQNLTPQRIETREKLESFYHGMQQTLDFLDYVEAKAFLQLTPEEQANICYRITQSGATTKWNTVTADAIREMNLQTVEDLWDNQIILRPNYESGIGEVKNNNNAPTSQGTQIYGYEKIWVRRWYIQHNDSGRPNAWAFKKNMFEMLGNFGYIGYQTYGSKMSNSDLDAIRKLTGDSTMTWKKYQMNKYAEMESKWNNGNVDADYMVERYKAALIADAANTGKDVRNATELRKVYYYYFKGLTNDFINEPIDMNPELTHITTAEELVTKINSRPYGNYILDNDIDFTGYTGKVTATFMGKLDGNGHKIIGNTNAIFQKIRYGCVKNLKFDGTDIPRNVNNIGILSNQTQFSIIEDIEVTNVKINSSGRNTIGLIGGAIATVSYTNCNVEQLVVQIESAEDFRKIQEDAGGLFNIVNDIDFTGYTGSGAVITSTFTGKIQGNGHTISNLTNRVLFAQCNGTVENLNIKNFSNLSSGDNVAAFATNTNGATLKNMKFEDITVSGGNRVAVVTGFDDSNSTFENISVKNANVTGTGVYVSTFIGRKYGGTVKNVFVQGTLNITTTENGGLIGAFQKGGTITNVITDVNITKPRNTYSNVANSVFNGSLIGNIYDSPKVNNCIAFGNMTGYTDAEGNELVPYKCVGTSEAQIIKCLTKCYEVAEAIGSSKVTENTAGKLDTISESELNEEFYRNVGFDESIWDFSQITTQRYPEMK